MRSNQRLLVIQARATLAIAAFLVIPAAAQVSRPATFIEAAPTPADSITETRPIRPSSLGMTTTEGNWSSPLPSLEELADYLVSTGWTKGALSTTPAVGLAAVRIRALERERPMSRNLGLRPILKIATIDYPDRSDVPGGNGNQFQRWNPEDAGTRFQHVLQAAAAVTPAAIRAVRRGPRIYLVLTEGHVFAPVIGGVFEDIRRIVSADPGTDRADLVDRRIREQQARSRIQEAQELLTDLGFYDEELDGRWGSRSRAGMEAFQSVSGLPATGEADPSSLVVLRRRHGEILGR